MVFYAARRNQKILKSGVFANSRNDLAPSFGGSAEGELAGFGNMVNFAGARVGSGFAAVN